LTDAVVEIGMMVDGEACAVLRMDRMVKIVELALAYWLLPTYLPEEIAV
jgi:hypothetical protein